MRSRRLSLVFVRSLIVRGRRLCALLLLSYDGGDMFGICTTGRSSTRSIRGAQGLEHFVLGILRHTPITDFLPGCCTKEKKRNL